MTPFSRWREHHVSLRSPSDLAVIAVTAGGRSSGVTHLCRCAPRGSCVRAPPCVPGSVCSGPWRRSARPGPDSRCRSSAPAASCPAAVAACAPGCRCPGTGRTTALSHASRRSLQHISKVTGTRLHRASLPAVACNTSLQWQKHDCTEPRFLP